jgi:hypothetical protein
MTIKLTTNVPMEINLNLSDVATKLAGCNSKEQANFFNSFFEALKIESQTASNFEVQLCYVVDDLNYESRNSFESLVRIIELIEKKEQAIL